MAVGMGEMTVVRVDAVAVLVRTREAGLGWRARAWVEDGSLYRVVAVVGLTLDRVVRVMRLALDRVVTMMRLALDGIVILMSMTLSRGIGLVSMARRIVPGSGIVVRVSCAIAQVGRVCAAVVDEIVQFCCCLSVTGGVVEAGDWCYQNSSFRLGWCRALVERYTKGIPGIQTP
jgi:hypothetical protein